MWDMWLCHGTFTALRFIKKGISETLILLSKSSINFSKFIGVCTDVINCCGLVDSSAAFQQLAHYDKYKAVAAVIKICMSYLSFCKDGITDWAITIAFTSLPIYYWLIILSVDAVYCVVLKTSFKKTRIIIKWIKTVCCSIRLKEG